MPKNFSEILKQNKLCTEVVVFSESTRTALDAATTLKCELAQIAKSLVFKDSNSQPVLIIASGINRVDTGKIEKILGTPITKADANFVKEKTGFTIGGIPPFGFSMPITTIIDEDLMLLSTIWAAAGTPNSVFSLTPAELVKITQAPTLSIKIDAV